MRAILIDADYITKAGKAVVRLVLKRKRFFRMYDEAFEPYFYLGAPDLEKAEKEAMEAIAHGNKGEEVRVLRVERARKEFFGSEKEVLRVFAKHPGNVPILRDVLKNVGTLYEHNIPFGRRYLIDKGITPLNEVRIKREGRNIKEITPGPEKNPEFRTLSFDIETYNPVGAPRPEKDPAILISYADENAGVLSLKPLALPFVKSFASEKDMLEAFCRIVKEKDVELLVGYNSAQFDLPYLQGRAKATGAKLSLGRDGSSFSVRRIGLFPSAKIKGRIHADLFQVIRFLGIIGALRSYKFTLGEAYAELVGGELEGWKAGVDKLDIWRMWDDAEQSLRLAEYSLNDAKATRALADRVLPLQIELARLTRMSLFDVIGSTSGQLVEALLLSRAFRENMIAPNKPDGEELEEREADPIEGAFVKVPTPGIYENLVVFDFRGLYPSIICSYNIDPFTINCSCCSEKEAHVSPLGHRFCSKKQGLVPKVLAELVEKRSAMKKQLKSLNPDSEEYRTTEARSNAYKIISNSFYGMLGYARARWYSREAAESVTAWGRHFAQEVAKKAEEAGFRVLYQDTDSAFLLMGEKKREEALSFMKGFNATLPGNMELELEGFYPRGVFVTKKVAGSASKEQKGAKKKYALLNENGKIKIRGFELVRRDWSATAKNTQKAVLEAILKEGSKEKAVKIVQETVERLKSGKVPLEELAIYTTLRKGIGNYEVISPELAAAQKAVKQGKKIETGSLISYVVTSRGKSISDKAQLLEFAKDYDANYYIDHQLIPSVLKILQELGVTEEELKGLGKQSTLGAW